MSFYQPCFDALYRADEAVVCQGVAGGVRRSPACRRLIRPDVLRGQGTVIHICTCGRRAVKALFATSVRQRFASCIKSSSWPPSRPPRSFSVPPRDPPFCALSLLSLAAFVAAVSRRQFCSAVTTVVVVTSNKVSN